VVEWSRALDARLSERYCSVSMVWVPIPSREEQNLTVLKSNSNTVWFNFQTYIYNTIFELLNFCSSLDGIWTHTIDTLQHQSLSLMSSALDHSTTSAPLKWSFNDRSVTLSRNENLEIYIRHVYKRV
jgi:hypothetical protein